MTHRDSQSVCIVIPCYRAELKSYEQASLERCLSVLHSYPIKLVKPATLDLTKLFDSYPALGCENFPDEYFLGIEGYNRLMLADEFYARFAPYDYILIHQLDAFVFSDQLRAWCERGYDYVGAPWLTNVDLPDGLQRIAWEFSRIWSRLTDQKAKGGVGADPLQYIYRVGNGGFSLRRVAKMRSAIAARPDAIERYRQTEHYTAHEDIYFSIEVNRFWPHLKIPSAITASGFSWESYPYVGALLNKGELPFGCHGWDKLHRDDWRPIFEGFGYDLDALSKDSRRTDERRS